MNNFLSFLGAVVSSIPVPVLSLLTAAFAVVVLLGIVNYFTKG